MALTQVEPQAHLKTAGENQVKYPGEMKTFMYVEADPKVRANMRASTRWDYFIEYLGYWIDNKKQIILSVIFAAIGVLLLHVFAPAGLLMIALAGKYRNQSWWNQFVYGKFGKFRTLVLIE